MKISVLGGGSFGSAIASSFAKSNDDVRLFCRNDAVCQEINKYHTNQQYLGDIPLSSSLVAVNQLKDVIKSDLIFMAVPSLAIREISAELSSLRLPQPMIVVNTSKGIGASGELLIDLISEELRGCVVGSMKGPTFARPIALNRKSSFTLAIPDSSISSLTIDNLKHSSLELEAWHSPRDVEIVSALKNIVAIVIGFIDSQELSSNTRYSLIVKLFREVKIILTALGADPNVIMTYAGLGDILLTSLEDSSRNRTLGLLIGKSFDFGHLTAGPVLEGVKSSFIFRDWISKRGQKSLLLESLCSLLKREVSVHGFMHFLRDQF